MDQHIQFILPQQNKDFMIFTQLIKESQSPPNGAQESSVASITRKVVKIMATSLSVARDTLFS